SHEGDSYRRIELITGNPRRRQWTPEEKAQIVAESFRPGVKASDVARRHGVSRGVLWSLAARGPRAKRGVPQLASCRSELRRIPRPLR
ncbi:MAG: transposase, partial [Acetobacteraceae bacterium]|nr:transposase [Acetobacteraceae bacterium]